MPTFKNFKMEDVHLVAKYLFREGEDAPKPEEPVKKAVKAVKETIEKVTHKKKK